MKFFFMLFILGFFLVTCGCIFHEPVTAEQVSAFHERVNKSLKYADRMVAEDPKNATAWCIRGVYYNNVYSQYETALESYNKGLALDPENGFCWYAKGTTLHNMQQFSEAETCFANGKKFWYRTDILING